MSAITPGTLCPICGKKHRAGSKPLAACTARLTEVAEAPKGYPYEAEGLRRTETRLTEARATIAGFVADTNQTPYAVGWVSGCITAAISEATVWLECPKGSCALADLVNSLQGLSADIENLWEKRETPSFILGFIDQAIQSILALHYPGYDPEDTQGLYLDTEGTFYSASGAEVIRVITVGGEIMGAAFHATGTSRYTDVPEEDITGETLLWTSYAACLGGQLTKAGIPSRVISNLMVQGF